MHPVFTQIDKRTCISQSACNATNHILPLIKKIMAKGMMGLTFVSALALADNNQDIENIKKHLQNKKPPIEVKSVASTPVDGIYEVFSNGNIYYVNKDATHIFAGGSLFESATNKNLTNERFKKLTAIKFNTLPFKNAIEIKKGTGGYQFAVFSDPDCPFCQKLEQGLEKFNINDYTAYVFLLPLKALHPDAEAKSQSIWCAKDKKTAWLNWMVKQEEPKKAECKNPINHNEQLADKIGVVGTPTIYLEDGTQTQDPNVLIAAIKAKQANSSAEK